MKRRGNYATVNMFIIGLMIVGLIPFLLSRPDPRETVTVSRVIDGDTFETEGGSKIRLIGIDTPESVNPDETKNTEQGRIASDFTKSLLSGCTVSLEYDKDMYDDYGRILAYVYLEDGQMLQEILLSNGYARTMTIRPNTRYAEHFRKLEDTARSDGIGFWNDYYKDE